MSDVPLPIKMSFGANDYAMKSFVQLQS